MSDLIDICDAAVALLAAENLPEQVTVQRRWRPFFEAADLEEIRVSVIPVGRNRSGSNLASEQREELLRVVVQRRLGDGTEAGTDADEARADALDGVVEAIYESFYPGLEIGTGVVTRVSQPTLADPEALDARIFHAAIEVALWRLT